jgi:hypothetical protein
MEYANNEGKGYMDRWKALERVLIPSRMVNIDCQNLT